MLWRAAAAFFAPIARFTRAVQSRGRSIGHRANIGRSASAVVRGARTLHHSPSCARPTTFARNAFCSTQRQSVRKCSSDCVGNDLIRPYPDTRGGGRRCRGGRATAGCGHGTPAHERGQVAILAGPEHEVQVVGHQAVGQQPHVIRYHGLREDALGGGIFLVAIENRRSGVGAVEGVNRSTHPPPLLVVLACSDDKRVTFRRQDRFLPPSLRVFPRRDPASSKP